MGRRHAAPALALVALLGAGAGAAAIAWTSTSTLSTTATSAPVELELGAGGLKTRYFPALSIGANETQLSGTLSAKAGADLVVKDVVRVVNRAATTQTVTLAAAQASNARVEVLAFTVLDGSTQVGILDFRAASPSVQLTLAPSASRTLDLRVDLADGAGLDNAQIGLVLTLAVTS